MESKVSIIIPTFNGATRGYLRDAVESVMSQGYTNYELIIINDGSTDNTEELCKEYINNPRVKYVYQENKGLAAARNTGIKNSTGEYICLLDDDDLWKKDKIKQQVEIFTESDDSCLGMVYCAAELIDENNKLVGIRYKEIGNKAFRKLWLGGNIVSCPSSVMIKRCVLNEVGIFNENMKSVEDLELWLRISRQYHILSIPEALVKYRIHLNRITVSFCKREEFFEYCLYSRLLLDGAGIIGIDEDIVYRNLYERTAVRRFALGDYRQVRKFCRIASAYGNISLFTQVIFLLSYFPFLAEVCKKFRRKIKLVLFKLKIM